MKLIKELNKWRDVTCSWIRRFSTVRYQFFPNVSIDSLYNQSKSFIDTDKLILKSM